MRFCFDLDKTLCTGKPYEQSTPYYGVTTLLKKLRSQGHTVCIYTARGMGSSDGNVGRAIALIGQQTLEQLAQWGIEYDELYFGKPCADVYVDDKSLPSIFEFEQWLEGVTNDTSTV